MRRRWARVGVGVFGLGTTATSCTRRETPVAPSAPSAPLALVTGAAGTLGGSAVRALVEEGYKVFAADLVKPQTLCDELNQAYGSECAVAMELDVTDAKQCRNVAHEIQAHCGTISVLVNNAAKVEDTTAAEWAAVMDVNVAGYFYLAKEFIGGMKEQGWGRIIMTGSMAAKTGGVTAGTAYSTSKGAVHALTLSLARESASYGVTVNAIAPAYVRTPMITENHTESQIQDIVNQIPVGRLCEPEEFGHVVKFLVSDLAGFITGEIIDQNGGMHMD